MINKTILGTKHPDVIHVRFGSGDIMFTKIQLEDKSFGLTFMESPGHEIGEENNDLAGKSIDDFPDEVKVLFTFTNPESVTALIHSLVEIQKVIFKGTF
jgi:hypothetical protein